MRPSARNALYWSWALLAIAAIGCTDPVPADAGRPRSADDAATMEAASVRDAAVSGAREPDAGVRMPTAMADASSEPAKHCSFTAVPPIVLTTSSGEQREGTRGSFCAGTRGCHICGDIGPLTVSQYTVVHPDDELVFAMPGGTLTHESLRFYDPCDGQTEIANVPFHEDQAWKVALAPGRYIAYAFANYASDDGSDGDTTAIFGLVVASQRVRETADADCKPEADAGPEDDAGM